MEFRSEQHQQRIDRKIKWFKELARRIDNHFPAGEAVPNLASSETLSAFDKVDLLRRRLHAVVNQLNQLEGGHKLPARSLVRSEYDVQELPHALLWIFFTDVRREDPVPQRAGASSRTDSFKKEAIIVEVKKTRSNLRDSQVGKELIVDIERYKARNDCKLVYCFVYDPDHYIRNPAGLEELSRNEDELIVKVVSNQSGKADNHSGTKFLKPFIMNSGQNYLVDLLKHIIRHPCFILRWRI